MSAAASIHFHEFDQHVTSVQEQNGFTSIKREHPDFGTWQQQWMDLGHVRIFEHRANLKRNVNVLFDDGDVKNHVHHCISMAGEMGAQFVDFNLNARLRPLSYHTMFLPEDSFYLTMGKEFVNVHIEVKRNYYAQFLPENESWADDLKSRLEKDEVYYPGEFMLTDTMIQSIHTLFNSPLTGSLKKLLIEAKVQELVALQLFSTQDKKWLRTDDKNKQLFHHIHQTLSADFLKPHSLKSICQQFGINEFALKKGFKEHFNTTVFDFLLSKRLEHARHLLISTPLSLVDISQRVGYTHTNHFSTAFKRKFGISPSQVSSKLKISPSL